MNQNQVSLSILKYFYRFCQIFGLCPFHYDRKMKSFTAQWYDIVYPILVWINFSYFYPTSGLSIVSVLNPLVVIAFFYMAMLTISVVMFVQCLNSKRMANLVNETMALFEELKQMYSSDIKVYNAKSIRLFLCKILLASGIAQVGSVNCCVILCQMMTKKTDYFVIFIVSVAYFLQTIVPNMFYTFILGIIVQYKQLNAEIQKVVDRINSLLQKQNEYRTSHLEVKFREMSKRLDYIATLHCKLTQHTLKVNRVFSLQLLVVIGNFTGILLIEVRRKILRLNSEI